MRGGRALGALAFAAMGSVAGAAPDPAGPDFAGRDFAGLDLAGLDLATSPPGAASCSGCHGSTAGAVLPPIHGRPASEIMAALAAFRSGERPATVMNRIAPGFTESETRAIANWLAAQRPMP